MIGPKVQVVLTKPGTPHVESFWFNEFSYITIVQLVREFTIGYKNMNTFGKTVLENCLII